MPVSAETLQMLLDAGLQGDALVATVASIDRDMENAGEQRTARQERNHRYYERRKASEKRLNKTSEQDVSPSPKKVPPQTPLQRTPLSVSPDGDTPVRDPFDDFWAVYPKREGENPKKPARLSFQRAVAKGADPAKIIACARQLAAKHPTPTPYVPQAVTWLNQERWNDHESTGPPSSVVKFQTVEEIIAQRTAERAAGN